MLKSDKVAIVIPAYNEEKLLGKTIDTMPEFVDYIIVVNDGSTDNTWRVLNDIAKKKKRVRPIDNPRNLGVGGALINGFRSALETDAGFIGVMAADAQCNPDYLKKLIEPLDDGYDYAKANRFFHRKDLEQMPRYRRLGNIFITMLTKFSTGYYTVFDTQNGYGVFTRDIMEKMDLGLVGQRYDYENTMLIALSIAGAKVKDVAVPAIYGDEVSTIKFLPTAMRALRAVWVGFWKRIYYKYVVYGFHPIALFLASGILFTAIGILVGAGLAYTRLFEGASPTSGSVMLAVLPLILGFQLTLTALVMDVANEGK